MAYVLCSAYSFFLIYFVTQIKKNAVLVKKNYYLLPYFILLIYTVILLGMQDNVGTDYKTYYQYFDTGESLHLYKNKGEFLFYAISTLISKNDVAPQTGFFVFSFLQMFFFFLFLYSFSPERPYFFLLVYFCVATAFINQTNTIRQYTAMNIFLFSIVFIKQRKILPYFLCIIFASLFHKSAIFLLLFYFPNGLYKKFSKKIMVVEILLGIFFMYKGIDNILVGIVKKTSYGYYLKTDFFLKQNRQSFLNICTKLIYIPFYLLLLKEKKTWTNQEKYYTHLGFLAYSFKLISMSSFFLARFAMYFDVFSYVPLYYYVNNLIVCRERRKYIRIFELFIFLIIVLGSYCLKTIVFPSHEYLYKSILFK